jgi:hypothetical protein
MSGSNGIINFIGKIKKLITFIKNNNIPLYLKNNSDNLLKFEEYIKNDQIVFDKYKVLPLTNNIYLSPFVIKIIDIFNRYFKSITNEFNIINFGFYVANDDKTVNYITSNVAKYQVEKIKKEIYNIIETINQYRIEKLINRFEIYYQTELYTDSLKFNFNELKKIDFVITYGSYFTYNNKKLIDYLNSKLIEGGNLILVCNMETPIKSILIKKLLHRFKKSIITKATLDDDFNWIFIGKGFIPNIKEKDESIENDNKILKFINKCFIEKCNSFDNFLINMRNKKYISESELINIINKKYIDIYRWCLNNKIDAINLFSDTNKEPQLINSDKFINYFFPDQKGLDKSQLKIFDISVYSITLPKEANIISMTIKKLLNNNHNLVITDGTANIGGNTLSFSSHFKIVNSIEYDKETFEGLKHNCEKIYKRKNITFYLGDCTEIIPKLKQDVIFIDPPWDGLFYKAYTKLHLYLGKKDIFDIISKWYNSDNKILLYCIKCPFNFDFEPFIQNFSNIYIQKLKNYYVIYILKK